MLSKYMYVIVIEKLSLIEFISFGFAQTGLHDLKNMKLIVVSSSTNATKKNDNFYSSKHPTVCANPCPRKFIAEDLMLGVKTYNRTHLPSECTVIQIFHMYWTIPCIKPFPNKP